MVAPAGPPTRVPTRLLPFPRGRPEPFHSIGGELPTAVAKIIRNTAILSPLTLGPSQICTSQFAPAFVLTRKSKRNSVFVAATDAIVKSVFNAPGALR